jgi:sterol desaturase/sphingolipid hydroxylase (fatty acid hydroxylase superfamily)
VELNMKIRIQRQSSRPLYERKRRRTQAILAILTVAIVLLLAFQAITALLRRDQTMGENYLGQPVGPGLQLAVCVVALAVGVILTWRHFHPKPPSEKREKIRSKPFLFRWPHDNIP